MWWSNKANEARDLERVRKVQESQKALLSAATSTADVAQHVTNKLKERLDDSLRQLESTANLLSDALIICKSDGHITSINPAAQSIFGWNDTEMIGRNLSYLFRMENGDATTTDEILQCLSDNHDCERNLAYNFTADCVRGKRRNGELFFVDGDLTYLERMDGTTIVMLLIRDITTRIELQRQLQVSETRYRGIFENSFDGIIVAQNYHLLAANPAICRMLEYSIEEMIAKPLSSFFRSEDQVIVNAYHTARLHGEDAHKNYVVKAISRTGKEIEFLLSSTSMEWEGKVASLISLKDLTELIKTIR